MNRAQFCEKRNSQICERDLIPDQIVTITLPRACPVSRCRIASAAFASG
jgi:hypothetical protein